MFLPTRPYLLFPVLGALFLAATLLPRCAAAAAADGDGTKPPPPASRPVYVLPVKGVMDKSMLFIFRRAFRQVEEQQPCAIILDIDTPGGGMQETEEIIAWLRSVKAKVPVYSYVNPRARSAGALLCFATQRIYMAPGSRIGSATPVMVDMLSGGVRELEGDMRNKVLADSRALIRGLAQENGHLPEIGMAMVDPAIEVKIGERVINPKGQIINLTAAEAVEVIPPRTTPLLATAIVPSLDGLLADAGLQGAPVIRFEETAAERLARWITLIGPMLLALGILCLYIEFKTPGASLPGVAGACLLVLYFFGHYVAGLAGWEEIVLVAAGIALLAVEVFAFPGMGILAIAGVALIVVGVVMGLIPHLPHGTPPLPDVRELQWPDFVQAALLRLLAALGLGGLGAWGLSKILPKTPVYRDLILKQELTRTEGYVSHTAAYYADLPGKVGVAETLLRPAGIATINGARCDVVSSGDLIPKGTAVRVIAVEGSRIVVEKADAGSAPAGGNA